VNRAAKWCPQVDTQCKPPAASDRAPPLIPAPLPPPIQAAHQRRSGPRTSADPAAAAWTVARSLPPRAAPSAAAAPMPTPRSAATAPGADPGRGAAPPPPAGSARRLRAGPPTDPYVPN
jgi:hypothetical protein